MGVSPGAAPALAASPPAHSAGLFPFSPALPAAFCPLNGEGAKPDGWLQRGEMTSEPPLFLPSFLCPHLAVRRYERARLKPSGTSNKRRGFGQKRSHLFGPRERLSQAANFLRHN